MVLNQEKNKKRIAVAMSGGVDSSVAAALLCKAGYDVVGVSMKLWPKDFCGKQKSKSCCSTRDLADARFVAGQLGIPFYAFDMSKGFQKEVIDYFCKEYISGRTPNPCIVCNNKIKFDSLLEKVKELGIDYIATGHYANTGYSKKSQRFLLKRGLDKSKDQSYVLFGLRQDQLKSIIFPLGKYLKSEVRNISKKFALKVAQKPESQEICFIWDNNYPEFLKSYFGVKPLPGKIITKSGKILGNHPGIIFYTIGQRRGLGLGGSKNPLYVTGIDVKNNNLIVGSKEDLKSKILFADNINWINYPNVGANGYSPLHSPLKVKAKIRYNHPMADVVVYSESKNSVKVVFEQPQSAITPGQAVVFYKGEEVLGGGWIR